MSYTMDAVSGKAIKLWTLAVAAMALSIPLPRIFPTFHSGPSKQRVLSSPMVALPLSARPPRIDILAAWYDLRSGTSTLRDLSSNANNGTISNGAWTNLGLTLNGSTTKAITGSAIAPIISGGNLTIIALVNPAALPNSYQVICSRGTSATANNDFSFYLKNAHFGFNAFIGGWKTELNSIESLIVGEWATIAAVRTASGGTLYQNNVVMGTDSQAYSIAGSNATGIIGAQLTDATTAFLSGALGSVLVYTGALSSDEIGSATAFLRAEMAGRVAQSTVAWNLTPMPILTRGKTGFDVRLEEPDCYLNGETVYCSYTAWNATGLSASSGSIAQASGPTLFSLSKTGEILTKGAGGQWDAGYVSGPRTYYEDGTYYLYYFGVSTGSFEATPSSIGVATSSSPAGPYTKYGSNPILSLSVGGVQPWEGSAIYRPFLLKNASLYYLFYNAQDGHGIGVATASSPLGPFTKYAGNPVLSGNGDPWAPNRNGDPVVLRDTAGNRWVMYYFGDDDSLHLHAIGRAFSADLLSWSRDAGNPVISGVIRPSIVSIGGKWYMAADDVGSNLFLIFSQSLVP